MSPEVAQRLAAEAMTSAVSTQGDTLMTLGQARARMDIEIALPTAPIKILDEVLEAVIMVFAKRRVDRLLQDVQEIIHARASLVFFQNIRPISTKKRATKVPRWSMQVAAEMARQYVNMRGASIAFGDIVNIPAESTTELDMKSVKDRPPTPVPSKTQLAEVTFSERIEDLPDPVSLGTYLPERRKLLEMINVAAKLLSRSVSQRVQKGMDPLLGNVTLPHLRHSMDWDEAVEGLAGAVVDNRVHVECADVRRTCEFLAHRILRALLLEMRQLKQRKVTITSDEQKDFYVPGQVSAG